MGINVNQSDWIEYLSLVEFSNKKAKHVAIRELPFKLTCRVELQMPTNLALEGVQLKLSCTYLVTKDFVAQRKCMLKKIKIYLKIAQK